jgi:hypothetical protein
LGSYLKTGEIMSEWYYTRGEDHFGPVTTAQLRELAGCGDLRPTDLVWKDGMTQWVAATQLDIPFSPGGVVTAEAPPAPQAPPIGQDGGAGRPLVSYYSPTTDMTTLARVALRGFPPLTGSRDHFPLTEDELKELARTARLRAPIVRAAMLYTALFYSGLLVTVGMLTVYLYLTARFGAFGASVQAEAASGYFVRVGIVGGLSILCLLASRATRKCQPWAPIAMIVHFALWIAYLVWVLFTSFRDLGGPDGVVAVVLFFFVIPPLAFLILSVTALTRIRSFLRRPLWTVHVFVQSGF